VGREDNTRVSARGGWLDSSILHCGTIMTSRPSFLELAHSVRGFGDDGWDIMINVLTTVTKNCSTGFGGLYGDLLQKLAAFWG